MIQKLELLWIGKDKKEPVEPRILIENPTLSYSKESSTLLSESFNDNLLIHGDNLLALRALQNQYSGKVKCIYIDPPYNTGSAFEHYDDNKEHSIWLSLMDERIRLLRSLLSDDGTIYIQIDDNEMAYLKVLCDEVFGRNNFITSIAVKMSTVSGVKTTHREKTIIKEKEYILVYAKNSDNFRIEPQYVPLKYLDKEFQYFLEKHGSEHPEDWEVLRLTDVLAKNGLPEKIYDIDITGKDQINKKVALFISKYKESIWRRAFIRNEFKTLSQNNPDKIFTNYADEKMHYYYRGREMFFLSDKFHDCMTEEGYVNSMSNLLADLWLDINTGKLFNEGGVEFRNSKKPEFLVARILQLSSKPGDLVLDSFLGSGTTVTVAHKLRRRWIGIEMGDHAYTLCKPRLDLVINGLDDGGVTKLASWEGGGGYKFYELGPTLVKTDIFGEPIVNKEYNPEMLAAAVALHEGFKYNPDDKVFWKQSKSNENAYLFVTTATVTVPMIKEIESQMADDEFLVIACKSFEKAADSISNRIKIKKIPQMLLGKCEFGKDNYDLNIVHPPVYEDEEEE